MEGPAHQTPSPQPPLLRTSPLETLCGVSLESISTTEAWTFPDRNQQPEIFLERLTIDTLWSTLCQDYASGLNRLGISDATMRTTTNALREALINSLIHGVLGIAKSETFGEIKTLPREQLHARLSELNPTTQEPKISVKMELNTQQVTFTIIDGGNMTEGMFAEKWKEAVDRSKAGDDDTDISAEQLAEILTRTSGMGFSYLLAGFTSGRGIPGGVVLTKRLE